MVQDNKQAARVVFEVWSSGQLERLDAVVAPHVVHHDPYDLHAAEGLAGMKQTIESDRKSTRLNSSHVAISYAVFCLKKKNTQHTPRDVNQHTTLLRPETRRQWIP